MLVVGGGTKESLSSLSISWICPVKISTQILRPSTAASVGFVSDWQWVCSGRDGAHLLTGTPITCCFLFCTGFRLALLLGCLQAFSGIAGDSSIEYKVLLITNFPLPMSAALEDALSLFKPLTATCQLSWCEVIDNLRNSDLSQSSCLSISLSLLSHVTSNSEGGM